MIEKTLTPANLVTDAIPSSKVQRYPFTAAGTETLDKMKAGYLVKFNAAQDAVIPALPADDALLDGIIIDLPEPTNPGDTTVAVAMGGSFNKNHVHYASAHGEGASPTPLSPAALARLHDVGIFLDPAMRIPPSP